MADGTSPRSNWVFVGATLFSFRSTVPLCTVCNAKRKRHTRHTHTHTRARAHTHTINGTVPRCTRSAVYRDERASAAKHTEAPRGHYQHQQGRGPRRQDQEQWRSHRRRAHLDKSIAAAASPGTGPATRAPCSPGVSAAAERRCDSSAPPTTWVRTVLRKLAS